MVLKFFLLGCVFLFASCTLVNGEKPDDYDNKPHRRGGSPGAVTYEGETYQTVVIGTQTWFQRNLNYNASGSKCYGDDEANCTTYGRLYVWATAMALPSSCNNSICSSQISAKHKGICPSGWHIPSDAEWTILTDYVGSNTATKLKTTSGWYENGTDIYGFAALSGGICGTDGICGGIDGDYGGWWAASEGTSSPDTMAKEIWRRIYYLSLMSQKRT